MTLAPKKPKFNETAVYLAGSSHFAERHHFKTTFIHHHPQSSRIKSIDVQSVSGGYLNNNWLTHMDHFVQTHPPSQQILFVVMLACNAVRRSPHNIDPILAMHAKLVDKFKYNVNVRFVMCGLIPSPRSNLKTRAAFTQVDAAFEQIATSNPGRVRYFPTAHLFIKQRQINYNLFSDGLHLNPEGASKLIFELHTFIRECLAVHYARNICRRFYPLRCWRY